MNKVDALVGKRVRARRLALKMSQSELGAAIGVKFQQIQKYETGINRISASRLWAISETLNVDVVHFFEGIRSLDGDDADTSAPDKMDQMDFLADREALEMIEIYTSLPDEQKRAVLAFVKSMSVPKPSSKLRIPG
jgi:transcriptional regulator with XRE-family HTH domain